MRSRPWPLNTHRQACTLVHASGLGVFGKQTVSARPLLVGTGKNTLPKVGAARAHLQRAARERGGQGGPTLRLVALFGVSQGILMGPPLYKCSSTPHSPSPRRDGLSSGRTLPSPASSHAVRGGPQRSLERRPPPPFGPGPCRERGVYSFKGQARRERGGLSAAASFLATQGPPIRLRPRTRIARAPERAGRRGAAGDGAFLLRGLGSPVAPTPPGQGGRAAGL